ncbi:MAG: sodium:calcium antiporter [Zetaproteobacteria bacterium]|nr:sodium:calcium antiporter [Zetaproteobacteria bacterium]
MTSLILVFIATLVIAKACDGFEVAADYLGRNMSDGVKGATINAIGSSTPELFATFIFLFLFNETTGFAGGIGTTAGSAVFNTMVIPALSILVALKMFKIRGVKVSKKVILRDGLMLIAAEFILIVTIGERLEWWHGMMLMLLYVGYAGILFFSMSPKLESDDDNKEEEEDDDNEEAYVQSNRLLSFFKLELEDAIIAGNKLQNSNAWLLLGISTTFIALACYILVYGCETFGHALGIQGYFVAVILAAAASSVPDTILSMKDAKKGNYDDAVANALGSNIFDICFALGLPLFLYTLMYGAIIIPKEVVGDITELRILLLILTIGSFLIFFFGSSMGKIKAYMLLSFYVLFTIYIVSRAYAFGWSQPIADFLHAIQSHLQ